MLEKVKQLMEQSRKSVLQKPFLTYYQGILLGQILPMNGHGLEYLVQVIFTAG